MSDHLFDDSILIKLQQIDIEEDCFVLCVDYKLNSDHFNIYDATKVWVENGRVKRVSKHLEQFNAIDAGMFLCSPVLFYLFQGRCSSPKNFILTNMLKQARRRNNNRTKRSRQAGLFVQRVENKRIIIPITPACHAGGREFKSRRPRHLFSPYSP